MSKHDAAEVGIVKGIYRYPVKSMAGEEIADGWIGWHGLEGDRRFAFVKTGNQTGYPWLTARDVPNLICYKASFTNPENIRESSIEVKSPDGKCFPLNSTELAKDLAQSYGRQVHLMQLWGGTFDAMDLSIISEASIQGIAGKLGYDLEFQRFRTNLLVETFDDRPFPEERWIKGLLVFGERDDSARVRASRKDIRCMVVNLDPMTAEQNPQALKQIVTERKNLLGIYGTTERPGTVKIGDRIYLVNS